MLNVRRLKEIKLRCKKNCRKKLFLDSFFTSFNFFPASQTSVCGHVMSLDFPAKYNNWDKVDPMELFSCATEKKEATPKLKMPAFLASEGKSAGNYITICHV